MRYNPAMNGITIVLQAGGRSTRMGRDKGLVPFMGETLIEYILNQVRGIRAETIVITNHPEDYGFLNLPLFEDVIPDWGALGGLHAALSHTRTDFALVLACDMPFINFDFIDYALSLAPHYDAIVPRLGEKGFSEPFRAVYRNTCLGPVTRAIEKGKRRMISFFEDIKVRYIEEEEIREFDPELISFVNVNTPEDLIAAEKIASRLEK
jgi:molybdopterin-guanine dinucleotide biosynthesis protein A